jgi:YVTN family beta-propeller protein
LTVLQSTRTAFLCAVASLLTASSTTAARAQSFVAFESGQVRPLAMSPDGTRLFAVNTPDNRLEIFDIQGGTLVHREAVPVGLEPVAVAARSNGEVWVVNHLSDSISIVDVAASPPQVTRTLLVGDEPRDIVFASGAAGQRAWVTTARRGQNSPVPPLLTTPGVGRALAWAFDPANLGSTLAGTPLAIVELFGDTPRALAVSPDGNTVYAAVFHSGNRTTTVAEGGVCDGGAGAAPCDLAGFSMPGGLPAPNTSFDGTPQPEVGLIVRFDPVSGQWRDELQRSWNDYVRFDLPDHDVFAISNTTLTPFRQIPGVGTIHFNMAVNPVSGKVYVSNTEARNEVRFEGSGTFVTAGGFKPPGEAASVIGHQHEARISVLDLAGNVTPRHLNKHIDYSVVPSPAGTREKSLATPLEMAVTSDGQTLYVAAFGSQKIGVFDTADLEDDSFVPSPADHIALSGGGPTGVVLDEANHRLYAATRFDNAISVIDTQTRTEIAHLPLYNPEPARVVSGRPVLYDATGTSSNGEASCSSCHVFGDVDSLAWDLGDPDGATTGNSLTVVDPLVDGDPRDFHPMKGPMTTQTLRGMKSHGAMHWRGDRSVGFFGSDPNDEELSFQNFIVAFEGLLGHDGLISEEEMRRFTDFILEVAPPPNPVRPLDNRLTGPALAGANVFPRPNTSSESFKCNACHVLAPAAGFFGANGRRASVGETQQFKVPTLRSLYAKVGMFGMPQVPFLLGGDNGHQGPQVRGFGMLHDGSVDTIARFLGAGMFDLAADERRELEQFLFEFPTDYAPIVGQQATLNAANGAVVGPRIDLMIDRAKACFSLKGVPDASECDLVAKGSSGGEARSWLGKLQGVCDEEPTLLFQGDRATDPLLTDTQLRVLATDGGPMTWTCVPPGSGPRIALDRDEDGHFDRDELDAGSDPADALSIPAVTPPGSLLVSATRIAIKDNAADLESRRAMAIASRDPAVTFPAPGGPDDPTCNGDPPGTGKVSLAVSSAASGQVHRTALPCRNWTLLGTPASPKGYRYKDRELGDGTVGSALWTNGRLTLGLRGKGAFFLNYDLVPGVSQDSVDVVFATRGGQHLPGLPALRRQGRQRRRELLRKDLRGARGLRRALKRRRSGKSAGGGGAGTVRRPVATGYSSSAAWNWSGYLPLNGA